MINIQNNEDHEEKVQVTRAVKFYKIDIPDLVFLTKKYNSRIPLLYKNKSLVFQSPFLELIDHNPIKPIKLLTEDASQNIDISECLHHMDTFFKGDSKRKINRWLSFIDNLEIMAINHVKTNGAEWFTNPTNSKISYKNFIKDSENKDSFKYIKWIIQIKPDLFVDTNDSVVDYGQIKQKDRVKLLIEIPAIWINQYKNQFGLLVVVHKVMVKSYMEKIKLKNQFVFDDSESENESSDDYDGSSNEDLISYLATDQRPKDNNIVIGNKRSLSPKNLSDQTKSMAQLQNKKFLQSQIKNTSNIQDNEISKKIKNTNLNNLYQCNIQDIENSRKNKNVSPTNLNQNNTNNSNQDDQKLLHFEGASVFYPNSRNSSPGTLNARHTNIPTEKIKLQLDDGLKWEKDYFSLDDATTGINMIDMDFN